MHVYVHYTRDRRSRDEVPEDVMNEVNQEVSSAASTLGMVRVGKGVNPRAVERGLEMVIQRLRKAMGKLSKVPQ